jgi:hypothetical protein
VVANDAAHGSRPQARVVTALGEPDAGLLLDDKHDLYAERLDGEGRGLFTHRAWTAAEAQRTLAYRILAERRNGRADETFVSAAMQWGLDNEANAIDAYEIGATVAGVKLDGIKYETENDTLDEDVDIFRRSADYIIRVKY